MKTAKCGFKEWNGVHSFHSMFPSGIKCMFGLVFSLNKPVDVAESSQHLGNGYIQIC